MGTDVTVKPRKHLHAQVDEDVYNKLWARSDFRGHFTYLVNLALKKFIADLEAEEKEAAKESKKSGKKETASDDKSPSGRSK